MHQEKVFTKVRGIDTPQENGTITRELEFTDETGNITTIPFPKDSMVIIEDGGKTAYDWYGCKVVFSKLIDHIVRHYGQSTNGPVVKEAKETFIVQKKNGMLSLAYLERLEKIDWNPADKLPFYKDILTGELMSTIPFLRADDHFEFKDIDKSLIKTPVMQLFCQSFCPRYYSVDFFVGARIINKETTTFTVLNGNKTNPAFGTWEDHYIVKKRQTIMDASSENHPKYDICIKLFPNGITILNDGHKLSAQVTDRDGTSFNIYTDTGVIEHMIKNSGDVQNHWWEGCIHNLWWYIEE